MALRGINHLAFITPDLEGTIRFYRDLLHLELSSGIGHHGYRHYFFRMGPNDIAFFAYDGASAMEKKFAGDRTDKPLGFDHVSFTVDSFEELLGFKDRLEAAGIPVHGVVDHGVLWSIYFYDPNNIQLEISWDCMEITETPAVVDDEPLAIVAEGAGPQPGHWPEPSRRSLPADHVPHPGNAFALREGLLAAGRARMKPELARLLADHQRR
jgi:catechol 2,3-dioxygenase-like lactoylglutathione lyase family enzyme